MRAIILISVLIAVVLADKDPYSNEFDEWTGALNLNPRQGRREPQSLLEYVTLRQRQGHNGSPSSPMGTWASYPEAASFEAKIRSRLESSAVLNNKPEIRQKLMEIADEKLSKCRNKADNAERACLGRGTGQVMQLVAAVENMSRDHQ